MTDQETFFTAEDLTDSPIGLDEPPIGNEGMVDDEYDQPSGEFIKKTTTTVRSRKYAQSVKSILNVIFKEAVSHEATVPDAAAILMYGPDFCKSAGDLADHDAKFRAALDWLDEGTSNPYLAFAMATLPFVAQVYRNHQDSLAPTAIVQSIRANRQVAKQREGRKFRIPFTKREITIRFRF